jgi:hypothetical protein
MKFSLLASVSTAAIGGVIAATLPQPAHATLTCTAATFSCSEKIDLGSHITDFSNLTATFDFFNPGATGSGANLVPSNATLQSVVLTEGGTVNSSGYIINTASSVQSFSFSFTERMMISAGQNTPFGFPTSSVTTKRGVTTYTNVPTTNTSIFYPNVQPNTDRRSFSFLGGFSTDQGGPAYVYSLTGNNATSFLGTGTFTALVSSSTFSGSAGGGGNVGQSLNTSADPIFTLVYNYSVPNLPTPTPEPASIAALGVGLTGLGAIRRRRKG